MVIRISTGRRAGPLPLGTMTMPSNQSKQHPYAVFSSGEEVKQPVALTKV
jgi:hypothetical protein